VVVAESHTFVVLKLQGDEPGDCLSTGSSGGRRAWEGSRGVTAPQRPPTFLVLRSCREGVQVEPKRPLPAGRATNGTGIGNVISVVCGHTQHLV
jgi:hypothetical protein